MHTRDLSLNEKERLSQFIKVVGHELKHPLTSLKAYLYLIRSKLSKTELAIEQQGDILSEVDKADRQINILNDMLNNIADVSKISLDQFGVDSEPVEIETFVQRVVSDLQTAHPDRKIEIKISKNISSLLAEQTVTADPIRLRQVLTNLITNAVVHTDNDDRVMVVVDVVELTAENVKKLEVQIQVVDTGPGIAETDLEHIFEPYYQVADATKRKEGLGLGLYIAQEIMSRHQGSLTVSSELDSGSTFTVHLPVSSEDPKQ